MDSMVNSMTAGLGYTSTANTLSSGLNNTNSMVSAFSNPSMSISSALGINANNMGSAGLQQNTNSMTSSFGQFSLARNKSASELSPGSRKAMAGLPNSLGGQPMSQQQQQQPGLQQTGQQAFNIQPPKTRKSGGFFGEDEDSETSMYFPTGSSNVFRPDKDQLLNQSQSPNQPSGFGNNFYSSQGINSRYLVQQQKQQQFGVPSSISDRNNALTPTSLNPTLIQQNSPNRGVISAIGQHRMMNSNQSSQSGMAGLQKRPIGSGLPSSSSAPISNLASSFGFPSRPDSSQPNFDLSDFPSLGNRVTPSSSSLANRNYVGMVSKNPVQDQTPEFQIQQEDFPALPGAQSTLSIFVSDPPTSGNGDPGKKQPMNLISGSSYEQALNINGKFTGDKLEGGGMSKGIQVFPDGRVTNIPQGMVADQFGIVGLLTFIRCAETDPSLIALAPGLDLTTLGLNLNSPEHLYTTFQSPWVDLPCRPQDIDFHVPAEYLTNIYIREKLAPIKLNRYGDDLLFFLFYMNGGDIIQIATATELYNRDWRYHKEERVWLTRAPGVEPVVRTKKYERGTYYFFDHTSWRKVAKEFHLDYDKLEGQPLLPTISE